MNRNEIQKLQAFERLRLETHNLNLKKLSVVEKSFFRKLNKLIKKYLYSLNSSYVGDTGTEILTETETDLNNAGKLINNRRKAFIDAYDQYFDDEGDKYYEYLENEANGFLDDVSNDEYEQVLNRYKIYDEMREQFGLSTLDDLKIIIGAIIVSENRKEIVDGGWDFFLSYELTAKELDDLEKIIKKKLNSKEGHDLIQKIRAEYGQELQTKLNDNSGVRSKLIKIFEKFLLDSFSRKELKQAEPLIIRGGLGLNGIAVLQYGDEAYFS